MDKTFRRVVEALRWIGLADPGSGTTGPARNPANSEVDSTRSVPETGEVAGAGKSTGQSNGNRAQRDGIGSRHSEDNGELDLPSEHVVGNNEDLYLPFEPGISCWAPLFVFVGMSPCWPHRFPWLSAFATSVIFAIFYAIFWIACSGFRFTNTFTAFWPPTGLVGGSSLSRSGPPPSWE